MNNKNKTTLIGILFGVLAVFSCVALIFWTIVPQMQGIEYIRKAKIAYTPEVITENKFIFEPNTNAQGLIRYLLMGELIRKFGENPQPTIDPLFEKGANELEEYMTKFPYYYDYFIMLGKAYEARSIMKNDESLLKTAGSYYKKALEVAPGRQDALYAYSINLISQGKPDEALSILKENLDKYPNLADNHYQVAQAMSVIGKSKYEEVLKEFEYSLDRGRNLNPPLTLQIYQKLLYYFYNKGDIEHLIIVIRRLVSLDVSQSQQFSNLLLYIEKNHRIPIINMTEK